MAQAVVGTALVAGGAAGAQPGLRARHRRADAAHADAAAARRPAAAGDATLFGLALAGGRPCRCWPRAPTCSRRCSRLRRCSPISVLHADQAAHRRRDAGRRGARRAAAAHRLDRVARQHRRSAALALFAIVFLWQIPHFMAIAWLYRDDYAKAGFPMLPVIDPDGARAGRAGGRSTRLLLIPVERRSDARRRSAACRT